MATAQSKLDILIEAKRQGQGLQQTTNELKELDGAANSLSKGLGGIAAGVGVAGLVALGTAAAGATLELSRAAAESERLGTAFGTLSGQAGQDADEMLAAMREASQGTISNTDLMLAANKAMLLEVADSADEMAGLLEVATARGKAMGLSTSQAFSDIVTGIGRESKMILDNLGIIVDTEAANEAYAASLGKTVEQLSAAERKQALFNQVMAASTDLVRENENAGRDAAANFERMDASIQNAKDALGRLFEPAMAVVAQAIADAADAAANGMRNLAEAGPEKLDTQRMVLDGLNRALAVHQQVLQEAERGSKEYNYAMGEVYSIQQQIRAITRDMNTELEGNATANREAAQAMINAADAADLLQYSYASAASVARQAAEDTLTLTLAVEQFNAIRQQSEGIARSIESAAASSGALFAGKQGGDAGLARQQAVTAELTAQRKLWEDQGYSQKEIADVLMPGYVSQLREADQSLFRAATHTTKLSEEAKAAQRAFEDVKSAVEGVLQGALDPGVGVDPNDVLAALGLPREDAINENARRLADIAKNGLMGQDWLGDFANQVPDIWRMIRTAQNPQEEAAYLLRDFQDGLLTSAIDKDKAKAIVRRQIMGDQNMAALAQEIAQELATEMGIPLQEALAAAQGTLGGGGTSAVGGDAARGFTDGANANLEETNAGGTFVDKFISQARASYAALKTAGADGGRQWGDGFMAAVGENVPPALINLLTNLVTPGVMAQFAQQGTLTGATP